MAKRRVTRDKEHYLVESYYAPAHSCKNVSKDPEYKGLMESLERDWVLENRKHLSESTKSKVRKLEEGIGADIIATARQELMEAGLKEPTLWLFPISRVNDLQHKNLNGRVYNKELWENVINNQTEIWKGGTGLANHPQGDDEADFLKQGILWYGAKIVENIVYGVGTFLKGQAGELAEDIINKGGRIGFSTAGFGDVLAEGVVDPETYEIERLADMVMNPSQGVFGNYEDKYNSTTPVHEKVEESMKKTKKGAPIVEEEEVENQTAEDQEGAKDTEDQDGAEDQNAEDQDTASQEGAEEEEEDTLSESLMRKHYFEEIKKVHDSNDNWRNKISKLDGLSKSVSKESVKESIKVAVKEEVEKTANAIMKEIDSVIPLGYQAKEIMEKLNIKSLSVLEGLTKTQDDMLALQEEYENACKKGDRLQRVVDANAAKLKSFAEDALKAEEGLQEATGKSKRMAKRIKVLEATLKKAEAEASKYKKLFEKARKTNADLRGLVEETNKTNELLASRNNRSAVALKKVKADRDRMVREEEEFETRVRGLTGIADEPMADEEDYLAEDYLNAYDDYDEYDEPDYFEGADEVINESIKRERIEESRRSVGNGITSLSQMFK